MTDDVENGEAGFGRWLLELVAMIGLAFVLALAIKTWVVQPFIIPSGSMIPTLEINDRVLVNKFVYRFRAPERGDIVVFSNPKSDPLVKTLIKRVVAVGGDTVDIKDGKLWINGAAMDEPYVHDQPTDPGSVAMPIKIPAGYVFLMGDNRTNSGDARFFGPQPVSHVEGEAFCIYWPLSGIKPL
ncbi:MAG TPA: signal peptidase I [Coriobacteriia bacterium]|jgi:signal peptidase I